MSSPGASGSERARRYKPLVENVGSSATACLCTMVQGNLLALTLSHWLIASRTGLLAGTFATAALWLLGERRRWAIALFLAAVTIGADYLSHPGHFAGVVGEAVVTGLAAGALSLVVGWAWRRVRDRRIARTSHASP